jgi:hypothetical protein
MRLSANIACHNDRGPVIGKSKVVAAGWIDSSTPGESNQEALNATNACIAR